MQIKRIFVHEKNRLLSIQFEGEEFDEFRKAFAQWQDTEYLLDFFEQNQKDLHSGFYGSISIDDAIFRTIDGASKLEALFIRLAGEGEMRNEHYLNDKLFKPLNNQEIKIELQQNKAYGVGSGSWLRIYAIRISADLFVVTGSAIKLVKAMQDSPHTQNELEKLNQVVSYLRAIGFLESSDYDYGYIDIKD